MIEVALHKLEGDERRTLHLGRSQAVRIHRILAAHNVEVERGSNPTAIPARDLEEAFRALGEAEK